jgi:hypothetical protein
MWCRSSLSDRAEALYVVNDALGSFLLRASDMRLPAWPNTGTATNSGAF